MSNFEEEFRDELAGELSPFSSSEAAYDTISQESKDEIAIEDAEDKEESTRMI